MAAARVALQNVQASATGFESMGVVSAGGTYDLSLEVFCAELMPPPGQAIVTLTWEGSADRSAVFLVTPPA